MPLKLLLITDCARSPLPSLTARQQSAFLAVHCNFSGGSNHNAAIPDDRRRIRQFKLNFYVIFSVVVHDTDMVTFRQENRRSWVSRTTFGLKFSDLQRPQFRIPGLW